MIGEYLFKNEIPHGIKTIHCNGKTYSREEFVLEREKFLTRKIIKNSL